MGFTILIAMKLLLLFSVCKLFVLIVLVIGVELRNYTDLELKLNFGLNFLESTFILSTVISKSFVYNVGIVAPKFVIVFYIVFSFSFFYFKYFSFYVLIAYSSAVKFFYRLFIYELLSDGNADLKPNFATPFDSADGN
jgi:hypothetical protein